MFSKEQVERGRTAYNAQCARCHGETLGGGENSPALVDESLLHDLERQDASATSSNTPRTTMPSDGPGKSAANGASTSRPTCSARTAFRPASTSSRPSWTRSTKSRSREPNETSTPLASSLASALLLALAGSVHAQQGATNGEWRYYGGDPGNTKYSPLDQINAKNVKELEIVWRWKADNFGPRPDYNWEVTPLMIGGVLYFTAGSRRDVVAVDAATGETLWMYRLDEGERGDRAAAQQNRGLAYWTDGKDDDRILLISPGYQLVALDAKTGRPIPRSARTASSISPKASTATS